MEETKEEKMYNALLQRVRSSAYLRGKIADKIQMLYEMRGGWRIYIWYDGKHVRFSSPLTCGYGGEQSGDNPIAYIEGCDATRREILRGLREETDAWLQG